LTLSRPKEMIHMTSDDAPGSPPPDEDSAPSPQQEPGSSGPDDDPGYLTRTGEAVGDDGSVAAIIGGLPAVEGSAWDIGASADERGEVGLADNQDGPPDQAGHQDTP
jgi:hypothetical protein